MRLWRIKCFLRVWQWPLTVAAILVIAGGVAIGRIYEPAQPTIAAMRLQPISPCTAYQVVYASRSSTGCVVNRTGSPMLIVSGSRLLIGSYQTEAGSYPYRYVLTPARPR